MARLPLIHISGAISGEHGEGVELMRELASRLRNDPTPEELNIAAGLFDRVADAGPEGAALALFLVHPHAPRQSARELAIYYAVCDLIWHGEKMPSAFKQVSRKESVRRKKPFSTSRVKAIYLKWRKVDEESSQEMRELD